MISLKQKGNNVKQSCNELIVVLFTFICYVLVELFAYCYFLSTCRLNGVQRSSLKRVCESNDVFQNYFSILHLVLLVVCMLGLFGYLYVVL